MSLKVRPFHRGGWDVDIHLRGPDGKPRRYRYIAPVSNKSAAKRWGERVQQQLLLDMIKESDVPEAVPLDEESPSRVPTLRQFVPRFIDGYARANRQKPGTIETKESQLRVHLVPLLGKKRLDEISNEDIQAVKLRLHDRAPSTINNVLSTLSTLLKVAVEWGVIDRMPCRIKLLKRPHTEMRFHDFHEYERLVSAARKLEPNALLVVLLGGEAGLRCGEMQGLEWTDIDFERGQMRIGRSIWKGHVNTPKSGRPRIIPLTQRLTMALIEHRHVRCRRVLCHRTGRFLNQKAVQGLVRRAERLANLEHLGVHALRHTFCSHLAMKGAPTKAIQELAGHSELITTQRYMHLSPAAKESAIRLLDPPQDTDGNSCLEVVK